MQTERQTMNLGLALHGAGNWPGDLCLALPGAPELCTMRNLSSAGAVAEEAIRSQMNCCGASMFLV